MSPWIKSVKWLTQLIDKFRGKGIRLLGLNSVKLLGLILVSPIAVILRILGIRFSSGNHNQRIGHLICEPLYMELQSRGNRRLFNFFVVLIPGKEIANIAVLDAFPSNVLIIRNRWCCKFLFVFKFHPLTSVDMNRGVVAISGAAEVFKYSHLTSPDKPFLNIARRGHPEVDQLLSTLGVSSNGWYVCLHNRENGYSPSDDQTHSYRNASISNFTLAVRYIHDLGGIVIRMGDSSMQKIEGNSLIIDYANSEFCSPENDLILASNCRFFLGNSSGLLVVAEAQGIPCVGVNLAPAGAAKFWGPNDISVPKVYRRSVDNSIVSFQEVFDSSLADYRFTSEFEKSGVYLQESSPDEILEACREMMARFQGDRERNTDNFLQNRFNQLFTEKNYSYYSQTKFSAYFLDKYKDYF